MLDNIRFFTYFKAFLGLLFFAACGSPGQKGDAAFEQVKAEKLLSNDSSKLDQAMIQEPVKSDVVKKNEYVDAWSSFHAAMGKKIRANSIAITALKNIPNARWIKKIRSLEQDNINLDRQIEAYRVEAELKWENFKSSIDHQVTEIGFSLKKLDSEQQ